MAEKTGELKIKRNVNSKSNKRIYCLFYSFDFSMHFLCIYKYMNPWHWVNVLHPLEKEMLSFLDHFLSFTFPFIWFPCGFIDKEYKKKKTKWIFGSSPFVSVSHHLIIIMFVKPMQMLLIRFGISFNSLQFEHLSYTLPWNFNVFTV